MWVILLRFTYKVAITSCLTQLFATYKVAITNECEVRSATDMPVCAMSHVRTFQSYECNYCKHNSGCFNRPACQHSDRLQSGRASSDTACVEQSCTMSSDTACVEQSCTMSSDTAHWR